MKENSKGNILLVEDDVILGDGMLLALQQALLGTTGWRRPDWALAVRP